MIFFIISLLVIGVIVYFSLRADSKEVKLRSEGRSDEQRQALRYFFNDGCLQKKVSDEAYDAMVEAQSERLNARAKAMAKISLDESQITEIDPIHFEGYYFDNLKTISKKGSDWKWRSTGYQITWLFFSSTQVYLYQYTFSMVEDGKKERTEEYFYKDITSFSTISDTVEARRWDPIQKKMLLENVDSNCFSLVVTGDRFYC